MRCDFEKLVLYLDKKLDLDDRLTLLTHLDECESCMEAIYQLTRDRDADYFVFRPYKPEKVMAE